MIRSWPSAISALIAIFHSNRSEMYSETRARNTMRANSAFREIVLPHVALTSWPLMSLTEMPARWASAAFSWSALKLGIPVEVGDGATVGDADPVTEAD